MFLNILNMVAWDRSSSCININRKKILGEASNEGP